MSLFTFPNWFDYSKVTVVLDRTSCQVWAGMVEGGGEMGNGTSCVSITLRMLEGRGEWNPYCSSFLTGLSSGGEVRGREGERGMAPWWSSFLTVLSSGGEARGKGEGEGNGPVVVILPVCPLLMGSRAALLTELKHKTPPCPPLDRVKTKSLISNFILRLYAILHASPLAVHSRFHAVINNTKV